MLEKMGDFFDNRLDEYEEHQLTAIESAKEFYPFTAKLLPSNKDVHILDLGCGTGLELEEYFKINPHAKVTGIDLASGMLSVLKNKFSNRNINLILGSYFEVPLGKEVYDAAVSAQSLHHFTKEEKTLLYKKVFNALKSLGYFILTDYFSLSDGEEKFHREELLRLKKEQAIKGDELYHFDTPLTLQHEIEAFKSAGFRSVETVRNWGATYIIKA